MVSSLNIFDTDTDKHVATILYIEDNQANLQLVKLLLARRNTIDFLEAETGKEGLTQAFNHLPDLILLDISLPDINGNEVLEQLRSNESTSTTPVIAISGNPVVETQKNCPGFQHYLSKPINIQALTEAIDTFIR